MFDRSNKNLYIHIGMNKTGSSSIQETLFRNLKDDDFKYVNFGSPNHGGAMNVLFKKDFSSDKTINRFMLSENEIKNRRENLLAKTSNELISSDVKNFIISGEVILNLTMDELMNVKKHFQQFVENIFIVAYIRAPKSFNESLFQQHLKIGHAVSPLKGYQGYQKKFEKFDEVFGKENVHLWKFNPKGFPEGDVVLDFCKRLGVKMQKEQTIRVNESLSKEAIALLYVYRKFFSNVEKGKQNIKENNMLINHMRNIGRTKYQSTSEFMQPVLDAHKEDIEWMQKRLGESLQEPINDDENAIKSENDLEQIAIDSVEELLKTIDKKSLPQDIDTKTAEGVATVVHALRLEMKEKNNSSYIEDKKSDHSSTDMLLKLKTFFYRTLLKLKQYTINRSMIKSDKMLVLHIGMNKTGSSSIQETLHTQLNDNMWEYVNIGRTNHGGSMLMMFKEDFVSSWQNRANKTKEEIEEQKSKIKNKLIKKIKKSNKPNFILSGETILLLSKEELLNMKIFLQEYFKKITVVSYARGPKSFNESAFQQRLKSSHLGTDPQKTYPNYRKKFEKFDEVFGKENVKIWKFNPKGFPEGDVVLDFCKRLGVEMQKEQTIRVNESLPKEAIALLYVYRKFFLNVERGKQDIKENRMLIGHLRNIGKSKYKVSTEFIQPVLVTHKEDIEWMEKRLGESLKESVNDDKDAIKSIQDLEQTAIDSVEELLEIIDIESLPQDIDTKTAEGVARIVHALRLEIKEKQL